MRRSVVALVVASIAVAACNGGDDDAGATTDPTAVETEPSAPPTTEPPPPTTEQPTITAASTSTTTTTTTTTSTTSTTAAPTSPTDAAVQAFRNLKNVTRACLSDLQACDTSRYSDVFGGQQLPRAVNQIQEWQRAGYITSNVDGMNETIEEVRSVPGDPNTIEIVLCGEDPSILAVPTATGTSIINDQFISDRVIAEMHLDADGIWRLHSYTGIGNPAIGEENSKCR